MENSPSCAHVLQKTLNLVISRCCFADDGKEIYKNIKRTCSDCFCSLNLLFCGVLVAAVVVAKAPDRLAQLVEHRTTVREVVGSNPDRTNTQGL